jgi:hypothetical protein
VKLSLLIWAINSQVPFNPFESEDWKRFAMEAGIEVDSAYLMKQATSELRDVVVMQARAALKDCTGVSVTADLWTSIAGQKYLVMTYHGLNSEFKFVHHVLDLVPVYGNATGNLIGAAMKDRIATHLQAGQKLVAIVSDSGSNMVKAAELGDHVLHPCFGHALKGVIDAVCGEKALAQSSHLHEKQVSLDLVTVKVIANVLRTTAWLRKELQGEDEAVLEMIIECVTRWEGKWAAIERLLKLKVQLKRCKVLKEYFQKVGVKKEVADDVLEESFFARLSSYKDLLDVFHEISVLSQSERKCSIAWIPSWIDSIRTACKSSNSNLATKLSLAVEERLLPVYMDGPTPALKAALLNPLCSQAVASKMDEDVIENVWVEIISEAIALDGTVDGEDHVKDVMNLNLALLPILRKKMQKTLDDFEEDKDLVDATDQHIFDFWKSANIQILTFRAVARNYLAIPATSAPSERAFSSTTGVATKKRSTISDRLLEDLTVCRDWTSRDTFSFSETARALKDVLSATDGVRFENKQKNEKTARKRFLVVAKREGADEND